MIYDRKRKIIDDDIQYGGKYLYFLYNNLLGRIILKIIINPVFSKINARYNNTALSKNKIEKFVKKYDINIDDYEEKEYKSFNDFFVRKKKKTTFDKKQNIFISPADAKLSIYKITSDLKLKIKQSIYTIEELINDKIDLEVYKNGNCLVFRLSMDDYHRYCFVDNGEIDKVKKIKGKLHTVSSISNNHKVYSQNTRICNYMTTNNFGKIIYIEVGALLVGKINNSNKERFSKGEEKGYFELGGSTIVILTTDKVIIDSDIIKYSNEEIETKVEYGERIGEVKC